MTATYLFLPSFVVIHFEDFFSTKTTTSRHISLPSLPPETRPGGVGGVEMMDEVVLEVEDTSGCIS